MLLEREALGMNNPIATNFYLTPIMSVSLFFVSVFIEDLSGMWRSDFFASFASFMEISVVILFGGALAFAMIISEYPFHAF